MPMRVLMVAPQPFFVDRGTPIAVRLVLQALSDLGVEVDLLTFPMGREVEISGVRVLRAANPLGIREVKVGLSPQKLALDVTLAWQVWRQLRRKRYDVLHAVEEAAYFAGLVLKNRPPMIYDMASSLPEQLGQSRGLGGRSAQGVFRRLERTVLDRADFVICSAGLAPVVRKAAASTAHREWRFPAEMHRPTPAETAALRAELGLPPGAPVILYTGNFAEYQGVDLLVDALPSVLERVPEAVVTLVGAADASEIELVRQRLPEQAQARIRLLPRQPRERMADFTTLASVLVSPRRHGHNFPLKIFDYLAAGRPIVATDLPAHRCVLDDSLALLVPATAEGLAEGIVRGLQDPALAARLTEATSTYAESELSWGSFVEQIATIYQVAAAAGATNEPATATAAVATSEAPSR
jgi:glycosyltransferase involved in cell wall biosynthesis